MVLSSDNHRITDTSDDRRPHKRQLQTETWAVKTKVAPRCGESESSPFTKVAASRAGQVKGGVPSHVQTNSPIYVSKCGSAVNQSCGENSKWGIDCLRG